MLVLLGNNLKTAEEVAEGIRQTLEAHIFHFEGQDIPITISAGVAIKNEADQNWESVYDRSDKALYHSKNSGRNMVAVQTSGVRLAVSPRVFPNTIYM